jgi:hypothetical protein
MRSPLTLSAATIYLYTLIRQPSSYNIAAFSLPIARKNRDSSISLIVSNLSNNRRSSVSRSFSTFPTFQPSSYHGGEYTIPKTTDLMSSSLPLDDIYATERRINRTTCQVSDAISADGQHITIIGFGSLLSEQSSRLTFPNLHNFRLIRVPNYRRVFAHPTSIFFRRQIVNIETLEMASLSCEYNGDDGDDTNDEQLKHHSGSGFMATAFEIPIHEMMIVSQDGLLSYTPSPAFVEREEEFAIVPVPYIDPGDNIDDNEGCRLPQSPPRVGMICARSTDEIYLQKWGRDHYEQHFARYGITTIWNWDVHSNLRPCAIYLLHCYKAAQNMGLECYNSFLDETYLVDRTTTLRQYIQQYPHVLEVQVPPDLQDRYCG